MDHDFLRRDIGFFVQMQQVFTSVKIFEDTKGGAKGPEI